MRIGLVVLGLGALSLAACEAPAEPAAPAAAAAGQAAADSVFADRSLGTHTVTGVLHAFEDAGFPMYGLEIGPVGSAAGDAGNLRLGAIATDAGGTGDASVIQPLVGQPVEIRYSVSPYAQMVDIERGGASVLAPFDGRPASTEGTRTIEGVLSGADGESGDLPSELTVTASDGTAVTFEAFIEPGMTQANGQTVTLRYAEGLATDLVSIRPAGQGAGG